MMYMTCVEIKFIIIIIILLFNLYVSTHLDTSELYTSYADDFTAASPTPRVANTAAEQTRHAKMSRRGRREEVS